MTDLTELRKLAEAASKGAWFLAPNGSAYYGSDPAIFTTGEGSSGHKICSAAWGLGTERGKADYAFIVAANPAAILSILDRVERSEAREKLLEAMLDMSNGTSETAIKAIRKLKDAP